MRGGKNMWITIIAVFVIICSGIYFIKNKGLMLIKIKKIQMKNKLMFHKSISVMKETLL